MSRFLFVSQSALIGDIAWQVLKEGHDVRYFIESESERDIADGFVPKTQDWRGEIDWAEVIVFDDTFTTGLTLREVALALRGAGAEEVCGVTLMRQPWR